MALFPDTRVSLVENLSSADASTRDRAVGLVVAAYRAPVVAVLRRQWSLDLADAEDLAHDFFAHALERAWLARYDPARGRFRTFLRTCLQAYASTAHEAAGRQKRGGHLRPVALDDETAADPDLVEDEEAEDTGAVDLPETPDAQQAEAGRSPIAQLYGSWRVFANDSARHLCTIGLTDAPAGTGYMVQTETTCGERLARVRYWTGEGRELALLGANDAMLARFDSTGPGEWRSQAHGLTLKR